ncbi:MAG: GGDEF domain-containing protein [Coriobacteriales bacterium]|nr:GGDEF domain-containing protein [Coriobacteriales bacterium]
MDLRSIFISNGVGVFILLMLLYVSRAKIIMNRAEDRLYSFMVFGVMLACVMEASSYALDGRLFPGAKLLNYIANTYLYSVNLLLPFAVLAYVDLGLCGDTKRIWRCYKPQIIIGIAMFAANAINFFIPISYYISPQNVYERRPFSYVYYIVILYYCISAMVVTSRYEKENGAKAFFSIHMFLLPILVGAGLQFMFYGLSLAWLSAAIGLTGLYMMQQNEMAFVDVLTDTYNRQYLNHILTAWVGRSIDFCGVMIDVDRFKAINDDYGHSEGDKALKTVADVLKGARVDGEWVFRFAGDEFVVLQMSSSTDELAAYMSRVEKTLQERNKTAGTYELSLSWGMSRYGSNDIDAFMRGMDNKMYGMKEEHHRSK